MFEPIMLLSICQQVVGGAKLNTIDQGKAKTGGVAEERAAQVTSAQVCNLKCWVTVTRAHMPLLAEQLLW